MRKKELPKKKTSAGKNAVRKREPSIPSGVEKKIKKNGTPYYRASLTVKGKHISLGSYDDPEKAGAAYQGARALLSDASKTILDYSTGHRLSFEKWVSMVNLRDNGIYIANPIYIRPKMFYYYYSPDYVLKFDSEDLFYYTSHKIMKRGNHLFVADYGMQVNILNRYGIRNHAVKDRDYRFLNGDDTDFRYANIEIKNPYHGVKLCRRKNKTLYKASINVPGSYVIGYYDRPETAAIAYNKAADVLKSKGCKRSHPVNFIDGMNPQEYAQIYTRISISDKICALPEH